MVPYRTVVKCFTNLKKRLCNKSTHVRKYGGAVQNQQITYFFTKTFLYFPSVCIIRRMRSYLRTDQKTSLCTYVPYGTYSSLIFFLSIYIRYVRTCVCWSPYRLHTHVRTVQTIKNPLFHVYESTYGTYVLRM